MKKKTGFTLVETMVVMLVIGILISAGTVAYGRFWRNNQTDTAETELRTISNAFSSYLVDYGTIEIATDVNYDTHINEIVTLLNKQYLSYEIKIDQISIDKKSVKLVTKNKNDPWGNSYGISIYTYGGSDKQSVTGLIVVSSKGIDGKSSFATYKDGIYGDDVIAIIQPKERSD